MGEALGAADGNWKPSMSVPVQPAGILTVVGLIPAVCLALGGRVCFTIPIIVEATSLYLGHVHATFICSQSLRLTRPVHDHHTNTYNTTITFIAIAILVLKHNPLDLAICSSWPILSQQCSTCGIHSTQKGPVEGTVCIS